MIANARMYSVSPEAAALWRTLLTAIIAKTAHPVTVIDHPSPLPLEDLWSRSDQGAVFMCGLPFSRARPQPALIAAPVPSPAEFGEQPQYWSELVVRANSEFRTVADAFGGRLAFTVPESQSGCVAALTYFMSMDAAAADFAAADAAAAVAGAAHAVAAHAAAPAAGRPWFSEIAAPTITPLGALNAVVTGVADIAPLDAYAFRLLQRFRPDLTSQVRSVGQTVPTPIPPLVASTHGLEALQSAFLGAHRDATLRRLMEQLLLHRFAQPAPAAYDSLRSGFEAAQAYWRSHRLAQVTHPAFARNFR